MVLGKGTENGRMRLTMATKKRKGWKQGTVQEFLELSDKESAEVEREVERRLREKAQKMVECA